MLGHGLKHQLSVYLHRLARPVTLSASLDSSPASDALRRLLTEISLLSDKIHLLDAPAPAKRLPSFSISATGHPARISVAGLPMGHAFSALVQALNLLATLNPNVSHVAIDGAQFPAEMERRQVLSVPKVYLNGDYFCSGWMDFRQILDTLAPPAKDTSPTRLE